MATSVVQAQTVRCFSFSGPATTLGNGRFTIEASLQTDTPNNTWASNLGAYSLWFGTNRITLTFGGTTYTPARTGSFANFFFVNNNSNEDALVIDVHVTSGVSILLYLGGPNSLLSNTSIPASLPPPSAFTQTNSVEASLPGVQLFRGVVDTISSCNANPSPTLVITTNTLPNATVGSAYQSALAATGGTGSYTWSLPSAGLPPGFALNAQTGAISTSGAPVTAAPRSYLFTARVSDGMTTADKPLSLVVDPAPVPPIQITTTSLPNANVGSPYSTIVQTAGGAGNYNWSVLSGSLPAGFSLNAQSGALGTGGSPVSANAATYGFTLRVSDGVRTADKAFTLTVTGMPLQITSVSLPAATVGVPYAAPALTATGGTGSYTWSVASGVLPAGFSIDAQSGVISSAASSVTASAGTYGFTLRVRDSTNSTAEKAFDFIVGPATTAPIHITTVTFPSASTGVAYSAPLTATGGTPPYTWSILNGALPAGFSLNSQTGVLSTNGNPVTAPAGTYNFVVSVRDGFAGASERTFLLNITNIGSSLTCVAFAGQSTRGDSGRFNLRIWLQNDTPNQMPSPNFDYGHYLLSHGANGMTIEFGSRRFDVDGTSGFGGYSTAAYVVVKAGRDPVISAAGRVRYTGSNETVLSAFIAGREGMVSGGVDTRSILPSISFMRYGIVGILSNRVSGTGGYVELLWEGFIDQVSSCDATQPALRVTTTTLPNPTVGLVYAAPPLAAVGGTGAYRWSIVSGSLPPGFSLDPQTGVINTAALPVPSPPATASFTVRVTSGTASADQPLMLTVAPASCPAVSPMTMIDPITPDPHRSLLNGPRIYPYAETLASTSFGNPVDKIAADGVAQILLRIPARAVGEQITLTPREGVCQRSDCIDEYGRLFDPGNPVPRNIFVNYPTGSPLTVTAQHTPAGPMAFVTYRAPVDFVRSGNPADKTAAQRSVTIGFASNLGCTYADLTIPIVRPPLIFIHGYNSDANSWDDFERLLTPRLTSYYRVEYGDVSRYGEQAGRYFNPPLTEIVSVGPLGEKYTIRNSHFGIDYNVTSVLGQVERLIDNYRNGRIASIGADVVAHSMGGLMAKYMTQQGSYRKDSNYQQGSIHKLITLGTPYYGSPQATLNILPGSSCSRILAAVGNPIDFGPATLAFVTFNPPGTSQLIMGAAGDLDGRGNGQGLSGVLQDIDSAGARAIPTAVVAGKMGSYIAKVNEATALGVLYRLCGPITTVRHLGMDTELVAWGTGIQSANLFWQLRAERGDITIFTPVAPTIIGEPRIRDDYAFFLSTPRFAKQFDPAIRLGETCIGTVIPQRCRAGVEIDSDASVPVTSAVGGHRWPRIFDNHLHSDGWRSLIDGSATHLLNSAAVANHVHDLLNTSIRDPQFNHR